MYTLGDNTHKVAFLKGISGHNLHEEFEAEGIRTTLTASAALVTGNTINGAVSGNSYAQVTFSGTSDNTMDLLAQAISAMPGVKSAQVVSVAGGSDDDRVINIISNTGTPLTITATVTNGASQATITAATTNKNVKFGMPVSINSSGRVEPSTIATMDLDCVGVAIMDAGEGELVTVATRGIAILQCETSGNLTYGACNWDSFNVSTGRNVVNQTTVTVAKQFGWILDESTAAGQLVRVLIKK